MATVAAQRDLHTVPKWKTFCNETPPVKVPLNAFPYWVKIFSNKAFELEKLGS